MDDTDIKIAWIEDFLQIKGEPIKLYDYQLKFLKDHSKFRIVNKSRQVGLSFIIAVEALVDCFFDKNHVALFVSTGERASKNLMDYVMFVYRQLPDFIKKEMKTLEQTKTSIIFKNGSRIYSLPSNPKGIRGFRADHVYLDEFAFMEDIDKIWEAIIPSVSRGGDITGRVTIISTPFGDNNRYYDMWVNTRKAYSHYSRHLIHWSVCPDLHIDDIKASMTEEQFRQEYCNEFVSEADSYFPYELIKTCVDEKLTQQEKRESTNSYYFGIDFGKENDSTVVTVIERTSDKFVLRHIKSFEPIKKEEYSSLYYSKIQLPYIEALNKRFNPVYIALDETGVGGKLYEDLRISIGGKVRGVKFGNQNKHMMITRLRKAFEEQEIVIPRNEKLFFQLHGLKRMFSDFGNMPKYSHRKNEHDDYVWSLALSYWIAQEARLVFV